MKRFVAIALAVMVAFSLNVAAMADDTVKVKGTVAKIDTAAKTITIKAKDGAVVAVEMEDADMLTKVKEGDKAEARYAVKEGKNIGTKVRKLTGGCE